MIRRCDLVPQYKAHEKEIHEAMKRVFESGRYVLAEEGAAFEQEFARYLGVQHAAGVGNATDGLILSLKALGIGKSDEVITTPFTAIPTISAIVAAGATPVFVDIDEETYLIDLNKIKNALSKKTKGIMPVHIFGNVVDIPKLKKIVGGDIPIIEDASQSHGSKLGNIFSGAMGDIGVFSFYPTKNLGGYGDGGMVVTNNKDLIDKIKLLRMYGMTDKDHIVMHGYNSRLDELQAAILRVKLKHLDVMNRKRNAIAERYRKELKTDLFQHQRVAENVFCNYHVFSTRFKGDREMFSAFLEKSGIQTNVYYPIPLHLQKANDFLGKKKGDYPHAEKVCREIIALPLYPEFEPDDQTQVIKRANDFRNLK